MKFTNLWADHKGFINLGNYVIREQSQEHSVNYELYAIIESDTSVMFGARFSNTPADYISGGAIKINGRWEFYGNYIISITAVRFFADHHPDLPDK